MTTQQPESLRVSGLLRVTGHKAVSANMISDAILVIESQHARITALESQLAQRFDAADMATAAQAVVDRWDTPLWKDVPATAEYIGRLRAALASTPAQPAAEASSFGSPELQAMIIARCVEKDQADSVLEDAARHFFDAGWKACANFCDRDDVRFDGIVGHRGCPQFEEASAQPAPAADCSAGQPCSTCPNKKACQRGCIRQSEFISTEYHAAQASQQGENHDNS